MAICRKDAPETVSWSKPEQSLHRRSYYSQLRPDGSVDNNALEDLFSSFEASWPNIVDTLAQRRPANVILNDLLGFVGFQRVRVPCFRDAIEQSLERSAQMRFDELRRGGLLPKPPDDFVDYIDSVHIAVDPHQSIHAMARLLPRLGIIIERFGYTILHNETCIDFITSDNPVLYFDRSAYEILPYSAKAEMIGELLFPVSPRIMLHGQTSDRPRYRRKGLKHLTLKDTDRISRYNQTVAMFAYEALVSRNALSSAFSRRFANFSPVLDPTFTGFDPENMQMPPFVFGGRYKLAKYKNEF